MGIVNGDGHTPPADYIENTRDSLIDLNITNNTELWLMQFPTNLGVDFDHQEVTLDLNHEGKLGSVQGSSGKEYDLVSFSSQEPEATVFASSSSGSKIVGRISRLVSVVNYPDPNELKIAKNKSMSLSTSSAMKSSRHTATPSRSTMRRSISKGAASTHSSRQKSALSEELGEPSKTSKRQKMSGITSSGSMGSSHQKKSKSKIDI